MRGGSVLLIVCGVCEWGVLLIIVCGVPGCVLLIHITQERKLAHSGGRSPERCASGVARYIDESVSGVALVCVFV